MPLPFLILLNLAALLLWIFFLHSIWALLQPAGISYPVFALPAAVAGVIYSFLILLFNKFLIQNRTDALPLLISRVSFAVGVVLYVVVLWVGV